MMRAFNGFPWDSPSLEPLRFPSCTHIFSAHTASQASHPPCIGFRLLPQPTLRIPIDTISIPPLPRTSQPLLSTPKRTPASSRCWPLTRPTQPMVIDDPAPLASNDQDEEIDLFDPNMDNAFNHLLSTIDNPSAPTSSTAPVLTHTLYSALATLSHAHPWSSLTFVAALP